MLDTPDQSDAGEATSALTEWEMILKRSRLIVSGDRIDHVSERVDESKTEQFKKFIAQFGDAKALESDRKGKSIKGLVFDISVIIAAIQLLRSLAALDVGANSGGKLHKSLHKGLHKSLHKGLHKSLHKSFAAFGGDGAPYGSSGMEWPAIEVPWREIDRLFDLREDSKWDKHWVPDVNPDAVKAPPTIDQLTADLAALHAMQIELRKPDQAFRRERIRIEATNDLTAYMVPLGADAGTPAGRTAVMFQIILWLGAMIGQLYKARYNVPRPNVLDPTIEPFIPVPVYSSWPSNHAFQSFLIAEVFSRMVPEHPGASALFYAAWEVAINREYAGLHYRSDTLAGKELARLCAPAIEEVLEDHRRWVRAEWLGESEEGGE